MVFRFGILYTLDEGTLGKLGIPSALQMRAKLVVGSMTTTWLCINTSYPDRVSRCFHLCNLLIHPPRHFRFHIHRVPQVMPLSKSMAVARV